MTRIPDGPAEITAAWLTDALAAGDPGAAPQVSALAVDRFGEGLGVTTEIYRLTPTYALGSPRGPASFVAKMPSSLADMRAVAATFGLYEREATFYRDIAPTISLRTPLSHFAGYDAESQRFILIMEDLAAASPCDQIAGMSLDQARLAIQGAAALHARWWDHPDLPALEPVIQPLGVPPYEMTAPYLASWPLIVEFLAPRVSKAMMQVGERLGPQLDRLVAGLAAGSRTLCHGDFRAANFMFREENGAPQLIAYDWQIAMQARGTFDIGYMMYGSIPTDLRRAHEMDLLRYYHRLLVEGGVEGYGYEECLHDYRVALLFGWTYLVQSGPAADMAHPPTEALCDTMFRRADAAINDHGLADLLD